MGIFNFSKIAKPDMLDIEVKLAEDRKEIKSLKYRMKDVEVQTEAIHQLAISVNELANNIHVMSKTQTDVLNRLNKLESEPAERYKFIRKTVISCVVTGVLSAVISAVLAIVIH